jgi:hypothetical protein
VNHAHGLFRQQRGGIFEPTKEKVGRHLEARHFAHGMFKFLDKGGCIPKSPKAIIATGKNFNGTLCFPNGDTGHVGILIISIAVILW